MSSPSSVPGQDARDMRLPAARLHVSTRGIQIALGLVWLLVGLFQFKSFMFTHAIVSEVFGRRRRNSGRSSAAR